MKVAITYHDQKTSRNRRPTDPEVNHLWDVLWTDTGSKKARLRCLPDGAATTDETVSGKTPKEVVKNRNWSLLQ